jgi:disulfide bond formation protein DsbB
VNAGIAAYHVGIEQDWWQGFSTCSSSSAGGDLDALRAEIMAAPVTRCDEATWFFLGLSMAGWNVFYSGGLGLLGLVLTRKK